MGHEPPTAGPLALGDVEHKLSSDESRASSCLYGAQIALETDTDCIRLCPDALEPSFSLMDAMRANGLDPSPIASDVSTDHKKFRSPVSLPMSAKLLALSGPFVASTLAAYSAGAYAMASQPLRSAWDITDVQFNAGITLFVAGFGFAPMILAPVSEAYGRYWVFFGSGAVFLLGNLGCALSNNLAAMLVSRFVTGSGAAVYATLTGGVVGDLYNKEERNTPMAMYSLSIMIGTGLGPLISGVVVDRIGWRWIFYLQVAFVGSTTAFIGAFFCETRANVLLQRLCAALNARQIVNRNGRPVTFQADTGDNLHLGISIIWRAFSFPLRLLVTESVVFWFSVWVSFAWAILYMQFSSIRIVFQSVYHFNNTQVAAVYTAVIVASILSAILTSFQDAVTRTLLPRRFLSSSPSPEDRLLPSCVLSVLLPVGLFWFGWSARTSVHWVAPSVAIGSCTMGIFSIYLAVFNYFADAYQRYASSAMAAQSMCRNLLAGIFPLVTGTMIGNLTIGGTGSLLGSLGLLLTAIPWILYFCGKGIRAKSPFANLLQGEND